MGNPEILLIGIGLSMDAAAVALSDMMALKPRIRRALLLPLFFGCFQGLMPLIGYYACGFFPVLVQRYAPYIVLFSLGFIGITMVREGLMIKQAAPKASSLTLPLILVQAIATSIDAFAAGLGFRAAGADIAFCAAVITLTTFAVCLAMLPAGRGCNRLLGRGAQILGGLILLSIAIKAIV